MSAKRFLIGKPILKINPLRIEFPYSLDDLNFVETIEFSDGYDKKILTSSTFLHLVDITACVLGVSYYKLLAPFEIVAPEIGLSQQENDFILDVYENGLGEFFARNNLKRFGKITFTSTKHDEIKTTKPDLQNRILLPIGGGKDSLVSVQLLEKAELDFTPFAVNPKGPIISSVKKINREPLYVKRMLDPEMIRLSRQENYYNGHVPSTAINSMIASLVAMLFSYNSIALSNERSASEGNVEFDGRLANHQYSKSIEFEKNIASVLSKATSGALQYFSLLRPFSEVQIANIFARESRFDKAFSSCNQNFKLSGHDGSLWCCNCPKCHFVFLILAINFDKTRLISIFGQNLLNNANHENAYRELTGLSGHKPWECVGEILEAGASLYTLSQNKDWQESVIVAKLKDDLVDFYGIDKLKTAMNDLMQISSNHLIPDDIYKKVMAHAL